MARELTQREILTELEPVAATALDRHLSMVKEWHPHDYVPWDAGRNFAMLGGTDWEPGQSTLSEVAKAALVTNLLTEDNLPSYHREIAENFSQDGAWGTWVGRWTAEENRHSVVLRDYLVVTRGVDPVALENTRMTHMTNGFTPGVARLLDGEAGFLYSVAYVSFQELATRVSHRNTAKVCDDPIADRMLQRVALDENLHMIFYRTMCAAALDLVPDQAMTAIDLIVENFKMPGAGMPNFRRNGVLMAKHGVYDLRQHYEDVLEPVIRQWNIFGRNDFGPRGEQARERLGAFLENMELVQIPRFEEHRDRSLARERARA
ncbi:acyl-ACP desaturase [Nocardia sp. 852002-20019_SCH5090214]|uniref:Acyl-ACP desaturase n=2 Tax=Nocardia TaxID=1817 RepID=A0A2T2YWU7_9NOCA|nr:MULTISPECIES: acyl-ACP desaturase [Nocardia]OBF68848.1 acyl-ACP desaturase [Mycobacterium sp. 852002-51759_SCH5129042]MBF6278125.1 acyl-ACP desaturase [Nocardia nova]OBA50702.1 acyl-ACP desaturase [Nocardia sp. 852002-20019_SCH5090214]OBA56163.1 acyl-ACP desaturase [Nocardia sp. 852002-51101_SCH5132738]OBB43715.1 acyl-ACP desaturase [Nocardia sp. 852002-51244_SCH5132740]